MKRILITGANSYIGTSFENYLGNWPDKYQVDTVDLIDGTWRKKSFEEYDVIFHVAGISHKKETKENAHLYYEINCDLAFEIAQKAQIEDVGHFIFMSSMSVYGMKTGVITKNTAPNPKTNYGKSKLQAEEKIKELACDDFKICILRPPMVYGESCKGNYQTIVKLVDKFSVFPRVNNKRSLIHIDNLVSFVKMAIDKGLEGLFFPQDREYINTMNLAKDIAINKGKRLYYSYLLGFVVILFRPLVRKLRKAFGNLIYKDTEDFDFVYCIKR